MVNGELNNAKFPIVPGHEIVEEVSEDLRSEKWKIGERVVLPRLGKTFSSCHFCLNERKNLCDFPIFTGYTENGGVAQFCKVYDNYCLPAPRTYSDIELASLVCAGLIGWRSYKIAGDFENLRIYGFGAVAHIITQVTLRKGKKILLLPDEMTR